MPHYFLLLPVISCVPPCALLLLWWNCSLCLSWPFWYFWLGIFPASASAAIFFFSLLLRLAVFASCLFGSVLPEKLFKTVSWTLQCFLHEKLFRCQTSLCTGILPIRCNILLLNGHLWYWCAVTPAISVLLFYNSYLLCNINIGLTPIIDGSECFLVFQSTRAFLPVAAWVQGLNGIIIRSNFSFFYIPPTADSQDEETASLKRCTTRPQTIKLSLSKMTGKYFGKDITLKVNSTSSLNSIDHSFPYRGHCVLKTTLWCM